MIICATSSGRRRQLIVSKSASISISLYLHLSIYLGILTPALFVKKSPDSRGVVTVRKFLRCRKASRNKPGAPRSLPDILVQWQEQPHEQNGRRHNRICRGSLHHSVPNRRPIAALARWFARER